MTKVTLAVIKPMAEYETIPVKDSECQYTRPWADGKPPCKEVLPGVSFRQRPNSQRRVNQRDDERGNEKSLYHNSCGKNLHCHDFKKMSDETIAIFDSDSGNLAGDVFPGLQFLQR